jgi:hypothetical protein
MTEGMINIIKSHNTLKCLNFPDKIQILLCINNLIRGSVINCETFGSSHSIKDLLKLILYGLNNYQNKLDQIPVNNFTVQDNEMSNVSLQILVDITSNSKNIKNLLENSEIS